MVAAKLEDCQAKLNEVWRELKKCQHLSGEDKLFSGGLRLLVDTENEVERLLIYHFSD